jgi:hypothetical protein
MTPQESRETFIETQFSEADLNKLKTKGLYQEYVEGRISINTVYSEFKEQGI